MAPFSFSGDKPRERRKAGSSSSRRDSSKRPRSDKPRSDRFKTDRPKFKKLIPEEEERRQRSFETPSIPADITGEELEKKIAYQIASLTPSNAKSVARHLVALERFLETEPERSYLHGKEIAFRAGRLGIVRERAGVAALRLRAQLVSGGAGRAGAGAHQPLRRAAGGVAAGGSGGGGLAQ